jgi:ComF family protein
MANGGRTALDPGPDRRPSPLQSLGLALANLVFPPRCVSCRARGAWLCERCEPQLVLYRAPLCPRCGLPLTDEPCPGCTRARLPVARLRAAGPFAGPLRTAIHRLKFSGERYLAEPLGGLLVQAWHNAPLAGDCLVPVPLHPKQERARGYNQALLLAQATERRLGLPVLAGRLRKIRETSPQVGLTREARLANLHGAFAWHGDACPAAPILVDDVMTTGATLQAAAQALRQAGARRVCGLVLGRAQ